MEPPATRKPVALSDEQVGVELDRLAAELRAARVAAGLSGRAVAEAAGTNQATVWRVETARTRPTLRLYATLAAVVGTQLELRGGTVTPETHHGPQEGPWRYYYAGPDRFGLSGPIRDLLDVVAASHRRIGHELWLVRRFEFDPPLDVAKVGRVLAMSHHTIQAVEHGRGMPDLASVIQVAGMSGRRLVLVRPAVPPGSSPDGSAPTRQC